MAVLAKELTREAIFEAIKNRRCYATSGARIEINFRINNAVMGEEINIKKDEDRNITLKVEGDAPLEKVTIIKNGEAYFKNHIDGESRSFNFSVKDMSVERKTDYYYIRVKQIDGRRGWSSPIWVTS